MFICNIRSDTGPGLRTPGCGKSSNIVFLTIFGRTDLRISLSKAKIEPEADFDVRFAVARQNPGQISKKRKFRPEIFAKKFFRRRKTKRPESFETRFGKVSCRSEPCSRISRTPVSELPSRIRSSSAGSLCWVVFFPPSVNPNRQP